MSEVSLLLESLRSRTGRWAVAALVAGGLHAGAVGLAMMYWQEDDAADDPAGALTVDMVAMPAPTPVNSEDAAVGPDANATVASPEASKQVVEKLQKDIPPVEPSPTPDAEVVLPKPQLDEKEQPKEEEAKEPVRDKRETAAAEEVEFTTRQPRVEAQPAPSASPVKGMSPTVSRAQSIWQKGLIDQLKRYKRYPPDAERRGVRGEVVVRFKVDETGQVIFSEILKSSGSSILDDEALALVKRASPFAAPPPGVELENDLPLKFGIK